MKIMKKSFSFVCCLFLAVSCFSSFARSYYPALNDGEYCSFVLDETVDRGIYLTVVPKSHEYTHGGDRTNSWFTAHKRGDAYILALGRYKELGSGLVLDNVFLFCPWDVWAHDVHEGSNQKWAFERHIDTDYYRIQNVRSGRYLTYDPSNKRVYALKRIDTSDSNYHRQLWKIARQ